MLKGSENGHHGLPLTLIWIVKPKRGVGSYVEKGFDPPGPTEPDLGPTVEKSSDPLVPTKHVSGHVQSWWF